MEGFRGAVELPSTLSLWVGGWQLVMEGGLMTRQVIRGRENARKTKKGQMTEMCGTIKINVEQGLELHSFIGLLL